MAEAFLKSGEAFVLFAEILVIPLPKRLFQISSTKVAEQLVQQLQEESLTQEVIAAQRLRSSGSPLPEGRLREFEVETERLSSKVHLQLPYHSTLYCLQSKFQASFSLCSLSLV